MSDTPTLGNGNTTEKFPVLPLRDIVVFPHMIVPLFVGREKSIRALEEVMREDKRILLVAQREAADDDPAPEGMYEVGTIASVLQLLKLPDGTVKVLVEGNERAILGGDRQSGTGRRGGAARGANEDKIKSNSPVRFRS